MAKFISIGNVADILGVSVATARNWGESGTYPLHKDDRGRSGFYMEELKSLDPIRQMLESNWESEETVTPQRDFTSVELFAGAGGLALGMEKAGFRHVLLNEFDPMACRTLRRNRPDWNVLEGDVHNVDFSPLHGLVDFLSGGFPCQAFSYAGKKGGLNDTRGTLFFELARAVKQIQPKVFLCENVKGLLSHDNGRTLSIIRNAIAELGYTLVEPRVLKAVMFKVPQKRERLFLVAIRNDLANIATFKWPSPYNRVMTLRDAFFKGELYGADVPASPGQAYPEKKARVIENYKKGKFVWGATFNQPYEGLESGEQLIRQAYYGRKWIKENLPGCDDVTAYNVDIPGRSAQAPQIFAKSGGFLKKTTLYS